MYEALTVSREPTSQKSGMTNTEKVLAWLLLFAGVFFVIVARRPDIIFNAQPWAEDGSVWMADTYNNGFLNSLFSPQNGYYQTISRLTYGIALLFGITKAALVANVIAIVIRCLFVIFTLSRRLSFIDFRYRIAAVVYFLLMPNLAEGYVNITNAHWYLSLYLMAVVIADDSDCRAWKLHDMVLLVVSSLSGPFVVFIAPCLLVKRIAQRGGVMAAIKGINAFDMVMAICCVIQVVAILLSSSEGRSSAPLGASFQLLANIISYRVIGGSFFSNGSIVKMAHKGTLNIILFIILDFVLIMAFIRAGWRFRAAALFPMLMICFALAKPMMSLDQPQWPLFLIGGGERYFFITNFAFFCLIIFLISKAGSAANSILMVLFIVLSPFFLSGFSIYPMAHVGYQEDVSRFETLKSGESMDLRINPPGWKITLQKK